MAISMLATQATAFAFSVWTVERPDGTTWWSAVLFASYIGAALGSFGIGRYLDSIGLMRSLQVCLVSGMSITALEFVLLATQQFRPWMLVVTTITSGAVVGVQSPAYSAMASTMVPTESLTRAQGVIGTLSALSLVMAPSAAGAMLAIGNPASVLAISLCCYFISISVFVRSGNRKSRASRRLHVKKGGSVTSMGEAWTFVRTQKSIITLVALVAISTLFLNTRFTLRVPLVLSRSANGPQVLGLVQALGAIGGIFGGLVLVRRRTGGREGQIVAGGLIFVGLAGQAVSGLNSVFMWSVGSFITNAALPAIGGISLVILQADCPHHLRGRVTALVTSIVAIVSPVSVLLAGPLSEGLAQHAARWAWANGLTVFGNDAVAGASLLLISTGIATAFLAAAALMTKDFRCMDSRQAVLAERSREYEELERDG